MKLIQGIGVNDYPGTVTENNSHKKFYEVWYSMLRRVTKQTGYEARSTLCDEWKSLSKFKEWFDVNYIEGYELDKDLLIEGNSMYSPSTCCFVPKELNCLFDFNRANTNIHTGIHIKKGGKPYYVQLRKHGIKTYVGRFSNLDEAIKAYNHAKYSHAIEIVKTSNINQDIKNVLITHYKEKLC